MLNKEFKEKDVNRFRNIIKKNYGDKTQILVGYESIQKEYKEGDTWEENGKTWIIKNGIKQNVTKLDKARQILNVPLLCPCCGNSFKTDIDKKMYKIHNKCFDCVLEYEKNLRLEGKYEEYEKNFIKNNLNGYLNDLENSLDDLLNLSNDSFITENGDVEDWGENNQINIKEVKERIKKEIEQVRSQYL